MIHRRCGSTLIELTVTIALIGIIASVATLAIRRWSAPVSSNAISILADSVAAATASSREIIVFATVDGRRVAATAHPDGSVTADTAFHFDPLSGRPANVR